MQQSVGLLQWDLLGGLGSHGCARVSRNHIDNRSADTDLYFLPIDEMPSGSLMAFLVSQLMNGVIHCGSLVQPPRISAAVAFSCILVSVYK